VVDERDLHARGRLISGRCFGYDGGCGLTGRLVCHLTACRCGRRYKKSSIEKNDRPDGGTHSGSSVF